MTSTKATNTNIFFLIFVLLCTIAITIATSYNDDDEIVAAQHSAVNQSAGSLDEDFADYLAYGKELLALTDPALNGIDKLATLADKTSGLLRFCGPVASIFAIGLSILFKDEVQLKTLREINRKLDERFSALSNQISTLSISNEAIPVLRKYVDDIQTNVKLEQIIYYDFANDVSHSFVVGEYNKTCPRYMHMSPMHMLGLLKILVVDNCPDPTPEEAIVICRGKILLERIEKGLASVNVSRIDPNKRLIKYMKNQHGYLNSMRVFEVLSEDLDRLENETLCFEKLTFRQHQDKEIEVSAERLRDLLTKMTRGVPVIDKALANYNSLEFKSLEGLATTIYSDLIELYAMTVACTGLLIPKQKDRKTFLNKYQKMVALISTHLTSWIQKKMESLWPTCIREYAKQQITIDVMPVNVESVYSPIAEKIRRISDSRAYHSSQTYAVHHQTFVSESYKGLPFFVYLCPTKFCTSIQEYYRTNIVITRHKVHIRHNKHYERALEFNKTIEESKSNASAILLQERSNDDLINVINKIRNGTSLHRLHLAGLVLFRKWTSTEMDTEINVGLAISIASGKKEIKFYEVLDPPHHILDVFVRFKMFFLQ